MLEADFNKVQALHLLKKHNHSKVGTCWQHYRYLMMNFDY